MKMIRSTKRLSQRVGIFVARMMNPTPKQKRSPAEREALGIYRTILHDPDTDVLTAPLSGKYYMKNSRNKLLLVLSHTRRLSIINSVYGYDIELGEQLYRVLEQEFNEEMENRQTKFEGEFKSNIEHSLHRIYETINTKPQPHE